jgi:hypothetical protein
VSQTTSRLKAQGKVYIFTPVVHSLYREQILNELCCVSCMIADCVHPVHHRRRPRPGHDGGGVAAAGRLPFSDPDADGPVIQARMQTKQSM